MGLGTRSYVKILVKNAIFFGLDTELLNSIHFLRLATLHSFLNHLLAARNLALSSGFDV